MGNGGRGVMTGAEIMQDALVRGIASLCLSRHKVIQRLADRFRGSCVYGWSKKTISDDDACKVVCDTTCYTGCTRIDRSTCLHLRLVKQILLKRDC